MRAEALNATVLELRRQLEAEQAAHAAVRTAHNELSASIETSKAAAREQATVAHLTAKLAERGLTPDQIDLAMPKFRQDIGSALVVKPKEDGTLDFSGDITQALDKVSSAFGKGSAGSTPGAAPAKTTIPVTPPQAAPGTQKGFAFGAPIDPGIQAMIDRAIVPNKP